MKRINNKEDLKPGTKFFCNNDINKEMEIVKIENSSAIIKDLTTGKIFTYGLDALTYCYLTLFSVPWWN